MPHVVPNTQDQAISFYRAALVTARLLDHDSDARVLDADADATWKALGGEFPPVVRCDLVLRNFAMLYPAAFAPGPVFGLSGWYDDAPWGTGFDRPDRHLVETLFAQRSKPESPADTLETALRSWNLTADTSAAEQALTERLSPQTIVIVAGNLAAATVARVFFRTERLVLRSQVILVSADPAARHALGITCALRREAGLPLLADLRRDEKQTPESWADREKRRLNTPRADLLIISPDASPPEQQAAHALATATNVTNTLRVAAP